MPLQQRRRTGRAAVRFPGRQNERALARLGPVLPDLAKIRQMGEILMWVGDRFFAFGDGENWLQNSQKWAKFKNIGKK